MSFLRNLLRDLIDKKLWPVAVVLVVALAAVPLVLGGGSSEPALEPAVPVAGAAPAPAPTASAAQAQVALEPEATAKRDRPGKVRNPFKSPPGLAPAKDDKPDAQDSKTAEAQKPAPTGGGSNGATAAPAPAPVVKKAKPKRKASDDGRESEPKVDESLVVKVRFGRAGNVKTRRNVARLTPLPSSTDPFFVFLGVLDDGKTAVFLISTDAVPTGDGKCKPSKSSCETVRMGKGDTEFFDVANEAGGVTQYQLDLVSISEREVSSKAVSAKK